MLFRSLPFALTERFSFARPAVRAFGVGRAFAALRTRASFFLALLALSFDFEVALAFAFGLGFAILVRPSVNKHSVNHRFEQQKG